MLNVLALDFFSLLTAKASAFWCDTKAAQLLHRMPCHQSLSLPSRMISPPLLVGAEFSRTGKPAAGKPVSCCRFFYSLLLAPTSLCW
jgi:hypothetical protein